jgi:cephalosporin-C deacetylase
MERPERVIAKPIDRLGEAMPKAVQTDYQSKVQKPEDFDAFWSDVQQRVAAIPLDPEIVPDPLRTSEDIEVFQVFYRSLDDVRIAAWYCRPSRRAEPIAAVLVLPGYQSDPPIPKEWARKGYLALSVAPRGKLRSHTQFNPGYPNLLTHNIVDRQTYAYRGFYADVWRGVDFLLSQSDVDPNRIGVTGSSQGGGLTITTAAMRPEVRAAAAGAPYLCGFMDAIELTRTYPYEEINDYLRLHPDRRAAVEATVAYFDGLNFADRITCPILVNIGLQDNVCPPETGYALFNRIQASAKQLYTYDGHGHDAGRQAHSAVVDRFFAKHLLAGRS